MPRRPAGSVHAIGNPKGDAKAWDAPGAMPPAQGRTPLACAAQIQSRCEDAERGDRVGTVRCGVRPRRRAGDAPRGRHGTGARHPRTDGRRGSGISGAACGLPDLEAVLIARHQPRRRARRRSASARSVPGGTRTSAPTLPPDPVFGHPHTSAHHGAAGGVRAENHRRQDRPDARLPRIRHACDMLTALFDSPSLRREIDPRKTSGNNNLHARSRRGCRLS